jgi:hypothetical protein
MPTEFNNPPSSTHTTNKTNIRTGFTHNTGVILEVKENTICALPWLRLADDNRGHDLLPQLRLSLLDGRHDHVTDTTGRETVKTRSDTLDGDDVQVASTRVVAAVHDGAAVVSLAFQFLQPFVRHPIRFPVSQFEVLAVADWSREGNVHWETEGHLQLATWGTTTVQIPSANNIPHTHPSIPAFDAQMGGFRRRRSREGKRAHIRELGHFVRGSLRLVVSSKCRDVLLGRRGEVLSRCGLERGLENPNLSLTDATTTTSNSM